MSANDRVFAGGTILSRGTYQRKIVVSSTTFAVRRDPTTRMDLRTLFSFGAIDTHKFRSNRTIRVRVPFSDRLHDRAIVGRYYCYSILVFVAPIDARPSFGQPFGIIDLLLSFRLFIGSTNRCPGISNGTLRRGTRFLGVSRESKIQFDPASIEIVLLGAPTIDERQPSIASRRETPRNVLTGSRRGARLSRLTPMLSPQFVVSLISTFIVYRNEHAVPFIPFRARPLPFAQQRFGVESSTRAPHDFLRLFIGLDRERILKPSGK